MPFSLVISKPENEVVVPSWCVNSTVAVNISPFFDTFVTFADSMGKALASSRAPPGPLPMFQRGRLDHFALSAASEEAFWELRRRLVAPGR